MKNCTMTVCLHMGGSRGGGGGCPDPLKNHKNIGFLSNTGPDPLKNHKASKPAFNVGPPMIGGETPFKWNGYSLAGRWCSLLVVFGSSSSSSKKKTKKKTLSELDPL